MQSTAIFSPCGLYRLQLFRSWDSLKPCVGWIMLNPSTANATVDDPTITRCIDFTKRNGGGSMLVFNLFAYRATDPNELVIAWQQGVDITGDQYAARSLMTTGVMGCRTVIAAWGARGGLVPGRANSVINAIPRMKCLGKTKLGQPRHPLYLSAIQQLENL